MVWSAASWSSRRGSVSVRSSAAVRAKSSRLYTSVSSRSASSTTRLRPRSLRIGDLSREELRVALERRQRVLDLVRHDGGHLPQRRQVPVLRQLCLLRDGAVRQPVEQGTRDPEEHRGADRGEHRAARADLQLLRILGDVLDHQMGRPPLRAFVCCPGTLGLAGRCDAREESEHPRCPVERDELVVGAREDRGIRDGPACVREHPPVRGDDGDPHEAVSLERFEHGLEVRVRGRAPLAGNPERVEHDLALAAPQRVHACNDAHVAPHGDCDEQCRERGHGEEADEIARTTGHGGTRDHARVAITQSVRRPRPRRSSGSRRRRRA